ncbi:TPA: phage tail protein [Enterobacter roggenkampii]
MATKYYALLTNVGAAKLANATALGEQVEITQMAVGDGNGALPTPNPAQTALVHELRRAPLNTLTIDPVNTNQIIAEQVIPEDVGGWWIREIGLYDSDGDMIAVANCAETYKPLLQEGSGRMQVIRVILIVSSTQAVTLKIDPSVVLATRQYVDDQIIQVKAFVDQQLAAHIAAADPHKQYAPKASPALTGTPTAPTATAGNNSTQLANTAFVQAALVAVIGGAPTTLDTLKEIATAINNDPNFSATINNALALKAPLASPAMTGTPTAPTAAQTVNNTQIATTEFVKSAIAALVASSPDALDTLNELAAALENDPNFATTVTNALAGKQPLDSTLTDLSGKTVNGILQYLGLVDTDKLAGRLLAPPMVITASGQFLMPSKGNLFRIRVQGAGGGSGSARATSTTGLSASGGGGGGAYVELWLTRAELQALIDVAGGYLDIIIGAGGVGGTGGAGGTGGTTQFGSLIVCPGGKGSDYGVAASTSTTALASGGASSADPVIAIPGLDSSKIILSMAGAPGHFGISVQSPTLAGHGANSPLGNGGVGYGASATQSDGKGYGSGAGGVSNGLSSVAKNGADGGDGVIIVEVYA